jgi:transcriptional regulator with XRE-family HTH domain
LFLQALGWVYLHLRLRFGLSLVELARQARVGVQTLCDLEHGRHGARPETEWAVAHALGYEPEDLWRLTRRWLRRRMGRLSAMAALMVARLEELLAALLDDWLVAA